MGELFVSCREKNPCRACRFAGTDACLKPRLQLLSQRLAAMIRARDVLFEKYYALYEKFKETCRGGLDGVRGRVENTPLAHGTTRQPVTSRARAVPCITLADSKRAGPGESVPCPWLEGVANRVIREKFGLKGRRVEVRRAEMENGARGRTDVCGNSFIIYLDYSLDEDALADTLAHEVAHVVNHITAGRFHGHSSKIFKDLHEGALGWVMLHLPSRSDFSSRTRSWSRSPRSSEEGTGD